MYTTLIWFAVWNRWASPRLVPVLRFKNSVRPLNLVRASTPNRHVSAAERPKIRRLEKSKGFVEPVRTKLPRPDNSLAHLLGCQRKKFGNRRASLHHGKVAFATDLPKAHSRHQFRQSARPEAIASRRSHDVPGQCNHEINVEL
jgi:hypothetical protein